MCYLTLGLHFRKSMHIKKRRWLCPADHTRLHLVSFLLLGTHLFTSRQMQIWVLFGQVDPQEGVLKVKNTQKWWSYYPARRGYEVRLPFNKQEWRSAITALSLTSKRSGLYASFLYIQRFLWAFYNIYCNTSFKAVLTPQRALGLRLRRQWTCRQSMLLANLPWIG